MVTVDPDFSIRSISRMPLGSPAGASRNDGLPLTDAFVHTGYDRNLTLGQLPPTGNSSNSGTYYTDKDGRFKIEGLDPGLTYNLVVSENTARGFRRQLGEVVGELQLQVGETKGLGEIQVGREQEGR